MDARKQIQEIALKLFDRDMRKDNKKDDDIFMCAPQIGKNSWTYKEYRDALANDVPLEDGTNPLDLMINYEKYLNEHGKSIFDKSFDD